MTNLINDILLPNSISTNSCNKTKTPNTIQLKYYFLFGICEDKLTITNFSNLNKKILNALRYKNIRPNAKHYTNITIANCAKSYRKMKMTISILTLVKEIPN